MKEGDYMEEEIISSQVVEDNPADDIPVDENDTMTGTLHIVDLYNEHDNHKIDEFNNNVVSSMDIKTDYDKTEFSLEWLTMMEDTIRYIDNILRNPNRFIINEEDIVKVELARRITVDSIKHLSRNTNLIQEYDKETGDIKPSKILNINKEESYDTYENKFIYSLIQNMRTFITFKKKALAEITNAKDDKKINYKATSKIGNVKYDIEVKFNSSLDTNCQDEDSLDKVFERITKVENRITDLTSSEVYKTIHKMHITLVTSPIKKTNVILKNTNFQYALKLWNYMQEHMDSEVNNVKDSKEEIIEGTAKDYANETFLLNYLILNSYIGNDDVKSEVKKKEVSKKLINSMLQKILEMDSLDKKEILDLIDKYYTIVKYRNVVNDKEIHDSFKEAINDYLSRFEGFEVESEAK